MNEPTREPLKWERWVQPDEWDSARSAAIDKILSRRLRMSEDDLPPMNEPTHVDVLPSTVPGKALCGCGCGLPLPEVRRASCLYATLGCNQRMRDRRRREERLNQCGKSKPICLECGQPIFSTRRTITCSSECQALRKVKTSSLAKTAFRDRAKNAKTDPV